ncbi:MAG: rhomboid family intramembrane serine protease [Opitutaceae bacterium]|nr:rhomboid family intramembrane serine protease [Opitutaceae bacterium]
MSGYGYSEDHEPVTHWRGHPVYASYLVVIVFSVLMVVTAVLGNTANRLVTWLAFDSTQVLSGEVWRLATYGLFNWPSLWFAIDMLMLWWFGRELERSFGRRLYGWLYGGIYLLPAFALTLIGLLQPQVRFGQPGALALFIAFATQYPSAPVFFMLMAKWAALILVGLYSVMALAARDWTSLTILWTTCGYAHLFVRHQQGTFTLPSFTLFKRQPKLRALPDLPRKKSSASPPPSAPAAPEDSSMAEVDALLDKIATSGIGSLTPKERAKLEAARADLLRKQAERR